MKLKFFKTQGEFRKWLEKNHLKKDELLVGFWRKHTGKKCMTWEQSVDEALCFGWIDGIRKSVNDKCYMQRYTPRRARSIWSNINIRRLRLISLHRVLQIFLSSSVCESLYALISLFIFY